MNKNTRLLLLVTSVIVVVSLAITWSDLTNIFIGQTKGPYKPGVSATFDRAVTQAQALYEQKKKIGTDFSSGPCLTNDLMPGWVVDIVHDPRITNDDLPANQCPAFVEGRSKHFVELDINGNIIRVR